MVLGVILVETEAYGPFKSLSLYLADKREVVFPDLC